MDCFVARESTDGRDNERDYLSTESCTFVHPYTLFLPCNESCTLAHSYTLFLPRNESCTFVHLYPLFLIYGESCTFVIICTLFLPPDQIWNRFGHHFRYCMRQSPPKLWFCGSFWQNWLRIRTCLHLPDGFWMIGMVPTLMSDHSQRFQTSFGRFHPNVALFSGKSVKQTMFYRNLSVITHNFRTLCSKISTDLSPNMFCLTHNSLYDGHQPCASPRRGSESSKMRLFWWIMAQVGMFHW